MNDMNTTPSNVISAFIPSKYQQAIFDFIQKDNRSAIIEAVAGSGKTTTIVKSLELIPETKSVLFLAFNKSIATELQSRVPRHVTAKTFHSAGFGAYQRYLGRDRKIVVESYKVRDILKNMLGDRELGLYGSFVAKLVGMAKNAGVGYLVPDIEQSWHDLIAHFDMMLDSRDANETRAVEIAREALTDSVRQQTVCDYDDMLYMPLIKDVSFYRNDYVFVDEVQDTNAVQRALLHRMLRDNGRLVCVGDSRQAIYGFRGADSDAMEAMAREFACERLPLTVSYRCPQAVVSEAQKYVAHIEAHATAPMGEVISPDGYTPEYFKATDAIICRNTAPLVSMCYALLTRGVGCKILGREIGQGLISIIKKMEAKGIERLLEKLAEYREREINRHQSKGNDAAAEAVRDRVECITLFIDQLSENDRTIPALIAKIEAIFDDSKQGLLTLCTAHKSKGLEWSRVFILDFGKYMPSKWAKQPWQKVQESNLIYVAITRAKHTLGYIDSAAWKTVAATQAA